jgi:hypothetical protein
MHETQDTGDQMLETLYHESTIILLAASDIFLGRQISDRDMAVIGKAKEKIADVYYYVKSLK